MFEQSGKRIIMIELSHTSDVHPWVYIQGTKFHSSACNFECILERTSTVFFPKHTCTVGRVLWEELLEEVILYITPICS